MSRHRSSSEEDHSARQRAAEHVARICEEERNHPDAFTVLRSTSSILISSAARMCLNHAGGDEAARLVREFILQLQADLQTTTGLRLEDLLPRPPGEPSPPLN